VTYKKMPAEVFTQHVIILAKTRAGKSSALRLFVEELLDAGKPVTVIDPKGDWWGIKSSADGKQPGYPVVIFGGEHGDVPLNARQGGEVADLLATGNRPALIDLGGWSVADRTRFFIDFAATTFRVTRGIRYLVIDEVHNFAPQGKVLDPLAGQMLHWANRLASEGLGRGVIMLTASQRPQKVHKDFVTSAETLIAMRAIHPLDRNAIKDWIDGCPDADKGKEILKSLATMPRGDGWVWSPEINYGPLRLSFPKYKTFDSFRPQGVDEKKIKGWAAVDLDEVRQRFASVIQEAEAKDPKRLQQEIIRLTARCRELNAELAKPKELAVDAAALERAYRQGMNDMQTHVVASMSSVETSGYRLGGVFVKDIAAPNAPMIESKVPVIPTISVARSEPQLRQNGTASGNGALPKAQRLILTALAQYHPQGRSKTQVALLTGYAKNGGGFGNAIGSLRASAFVVDRTDGLMDITPAGIVALGRFDTLPSGRALLEHWCAQLGKAERLILTALHEAYPNGMDKDELGRRTNYEPKGGGFGNALGRLRTLELIHGKGTLYVSVDLL
jgi:uncharacterized protein